jgi:hypothetical protein
MRDNPTKQGTMRIFTLFFLAALVFVPVSSAQHRVKNGKGYYEYFHIAFRENVITLKDSSRDQSFSSIGAGVMRSVFPISKWHDTITVDKPQEATFDPVFSHYFEIHFAKPLEESKVKALMKRLGALSYVRGTALPATSVGE